jgi:hypothetical protein
MLRNALRRAISPLRNHKRAREKARGIRTDVPIPFDMFDVARTKKEAKSAEKLENIYHKGQHRVWNGREVLHDLMETHGGIQLTPEQGTALQGLFAVILWGELAAWKVSAALANRLEPLEAKLAATSQAHDEARHFYVMHEYLERTGAVPKELGPCTEKVLRGTLEAGSLTKQLVGMQMMVEPMALALFQLVREAEVEPVLTELLRYYERDEARHVALGVLHLPQLLKQMSAVEAVDLWAWEFREYWNQLGMIRELEPHFAVLGIDVRDVIRIGRAKQLRANQMLWDELGAPQPVKEVFVRFFDAKCAWHWPEEPPFDLLDRVRMAFEASGRGFGEVPFALSPVAG